MKIGFGLLRNKLKALGQLLCERSDEISRLTAERDAMKAEIASRLCAPLLNTVFNIIKHRGAYK